MERRKRIEWLAYQSFDDDDDHHHHHHHNHDYDRVRVNIRSKEEPARLCT